MVDTVDDLFAQPVQPTPMPVQRGAGTYYPRGAAQVTPPQPAIAPVTQPVQPGQMAQADPFAQPPQLARPYREMTAAGLTGRYYPRGSGSSGNYNDPFGLGALGMNAVDDEAEEGSFWGKVGGYLLQAAGEIPYGIGLLGNAVNDRLFRDEGEEASGFFTWLQDNGRDIGEFGEGIVDRSTSQRAKDVSAAMAAEWENRPADQSWATTALQSIGHLFEEGGGEVVSSAVVGTLANMGVGGAAGAATKIGTRAATRTIARGLGKTPVDAAGNAIARDTAESLLEAKVAGGLLRRTGKRMLDTATDARIIGMSAVAGAGVGRSTEENARQVLADLGDNRKTMVIWQNIRDGLIAATGRVPSDEEVDERFITAQSAQSALIATGATLGLTTLSPLSEGAFVRAIGGLGAARPVVEAAERATTAGRVLQRTGSTAAGAAREGVAEGLEEALQSGLPADAVIQQALAGGGTIDQIMTAYSTPEAGQGAVMGGLLGALMGGGVGAMSRYDADPSGIGEAIQESGRQVRSEDTDPARRDEQMQALRARAEAGDARATAELALIEQDAAARAAESERMATERRATMDRLRREAEAKERADQEAAVLLNNRSKFAALSAVTGIDARDLGANPVFGANTEHGIYKGGDGVVVVFSTDQGALGINEEQSAVVYAAPEAPTEWADLTSAPASMQQAARAAVMLGSKESSEELTYRPGIDVAAALPTLADTTYTGSDYDVQAAAVRGEIESLIASVQSQAEQNVDELMAGRPDAPALYDETMVDADVLDRYQRATAQARAQTTADMWRDWDRSTDTRGLLIPPPDIFADPATPIGVADYRDGLTRTYGARKQALDRVLDPTKREAAVEYVTKRFGPIADNAVAQALIEHRGDPDMLRQIVSGERRRLLSGQAGGRRLRAVDDTNREIAAHLLRASELRDLLVQALGDNGVIQTGNDAALGELVGQVGELVRPGVTQEAAATVEQLLASRESELMSQTGLDAALLQGRRQAVFEAQAAEEAAQAERAAEALAQASNTGEVVRALSFLPPSLTRRVMDAEGIRGDQVMDLMATDLPLTGGLANMAAGLEFANAVQQYADAREGPAHIYGPGSRIKRIAANTELQAEYAAAVQEIGVLQLAKAVANGEPVASVVRDMVTLYDVSVNEATNFYVRVLNEADRYSQGDTARAALLLHEREAQKRLDDVMMKALTASNQTLGAQLAAEQVVEQVASLPPEAQPEARRQALGVAEMMQTEAFKKVAREGFAAQAKGDQLAPTMAAVEGELAVDYVPGRASTMDPSVVGEFVERKRQELIHLSDVLNIRWWRNAADAKAATRTPHNNFAALTEAPNDRNGNKTTIHLVADRIHNTDQLERKFRHELVGHFGLNRLLGPSMPVLRNAVIEQVQRGKGKAADKIREFYNANLRVWQDNARTALAQEGIEATPERIKNYTDAFAGHIADETLASLVEYSQEGALAGRTVKPVVDHIRKAFGDAGLTVRSTQDILDILREAEGFVNDQTPDLIKRERVAATYRNRIARDNANNAPFIRRSALSNFWRKLTSDFAGIREWEAIVARLAPQSVETARRLTRQLESAATTVQTLQSEMLDAYVAPIRRKLTNVKKELSLSEADTTAYFSAYMVAQHAPERNRSFWLLTNKQGIPEVIQQQRDAIYQNAVQTGTDTNGVWERALDQIEAVILSNAQSANEYRNTVGNPEWDQNVTGISLNEVERLRSAIPDAFAKALDRHGVIKLHDEGQRAILEKRRESGIYSGDSYARIRIHNWQHYLPMTREEGASYAGDRADTSIAPMTAATPLDNYKQINVRWLEGPEGVYATSDTGRTLTGGRGFDALPTILHTMERDAYYTAHEVVNARIGREMIESVEAVVAASPEHEGRIRDQFVEVGPPYAWNDNNPQGPSPTATNAYVVGYEDGTQRVIHFKDEAIAASFMSRFLNPLSDRGAFEGKIASAVQAPTRFLSRAFTTQNPGFVWFRQFPRDLQQNVMIAMSEHGVGFGKASSIVTRAMSYIAPMEQFFMAEPSRRQEILEAARNDPKHKLHRFARRYEHGGIPLYDEAILSQVTRAGEVGGEFRSTYDEAVWSTSPGQAARRAGGVALATYRQINQIANANASAFDNAARQALNDVLIEHGLSEEQAAQVARNTLNFGNRSAAGRFLAPYFAFAQTALTSLDAMTESRLWKGGRIPRVADEDGSGGFKMRLRDGWINDLNTSWLIGRIAMGAMVTGATAMLMGGDEDEFGRSTFDKLDVRTLLTNTLVPNPTGGDPIKVPIQVGFDSLFHALGAATYLMAQGHDDHNGTLWGELTAVATMSLTPFSTQFGEDIDVQNFMSAVLPTIAQPLYSAGRESRIARGFEADGERYSSTGMNEMLDDASRAMRDMTGLDVPPEAMRAVLGEYGGGWWKLIDSASRMIYGNDDNLQMVEDRGPMAALTRYLGPTARDAQYDAQQSYYHFVSEHDRLRAMVERAKDMDGLPRGEGGFTYSPSKFGPAEAARAPNVAAFHARYGARYGEASRVIREMRQQINRIKSEVNVRRVGDMDRGNIGPLIARERRLYELASARLRQLYADADGASVVTEEPKFQRWWVN